jgi:hypothetical protein
MIYIIGVGRRQGQKCRNLTPAMSCARRARVVTLIDFFSPTDVGKGCQLGVRGRRSVADEAIQFVMSHLSDASGQNLFPFGSSILPKWLARAREGICGHLNIPAALERSRSGNGARADWLELPSRPATIRPRGPAELVRTSGVPLLGPVRSRMHEAVKAAT